MACEPGGVHDTKCYAKQWAVKGDMRSGAKKKEEHKEKGAEKDHHKRRRKRDEGDHGTKMKIIANSSKIGIPSMFSTFMFSDIDIRPNFFRFPAVSYHILNECRFIAKVGSTLSLYLFFLPICLLARFVCPSIFLSSDIV